MATRAELVAALKAADAAGDEASARKLAAAVTNYSDENSIDLGPAPAPPPAAAGLGEDVPMWQKMMQYPADTGRLIGNGVTLGGYDALMGKVAPYIGGSDTEGQRAITDAARQRGGTAGSVLELGSSLVPAALTDGATALPTMSSGFTKALAALVIGGAEGAGYGGIQAGFEGRDPVKGMRNGALFGAGGQAAAGALSRVGSKIGELIHGKPPRMTADNLRTAKDQAYDAVNRAGVEYTPGTIRGMLADMDAASPAYPGRHDQVIAAKNQVNSNIGTVPRPITLPEVDLNRQIIGRDLNSLPDAAQKGMGLDITNAMDDYLKNNVTPLGVTARSGDPAAGLDLMNQARELNGRMRKTEDMTRVEDKAELQASKNMESGFDSTMRNNVAGILTNPKKMKGYSPDEEAAMRKVVTGGGPLSKTNIARQVGRMAPGGGLSLGASGISTGIAAALTQGNPAAMTLAALAPSAVGFAGKKIAERGTRKASNELLDLVANGRPTPKAPKISSQDRDTLGRFLMMMQLNGQHQ